MSSKLVIQPKTSRKHKSSEEISTTCILCNKSCNERHNDYKKDLWDKVKETAENWKGK